MYADGTELRRAVARRGQSLEEDVLALAQKAGHRGADTPEEDLGTEAGELEAA